MTVRRAGGKGEMKNKKKYAASRAIMALLLLLLCLLAGIIAAMVRSVLEARALVYRYIEETAGLRVEQISEDLNRINYEVISWTNKNKSACAALRFLRPDRSESYGQITAIQEQLRNWKIRYPAAHGFYLYLEQEDTLILDSGTIYTDSRAVGGSGALWEALHSERHGATVYSEWDFAQDEKEAYAYSRYTSGGVTAGCLIRMEELLASLRIDNLGYRGVPYLIDESGAVFCAAADREAIGAERAEGKSGAETQSGEWSEAVPDKNGARASLFEDGIFSRARLYTYPISGLTGDGRSFYVRVVPEKGMLERILSLQVLMVLLTAAVIAGTAAVLRGSYMVRRLRIDLYQKELERQKTELEAVQMQIKPHFYLNCLSLVHSLAEAGGEARIVQITQLLSDYMRYVMKDAMETVPLREEMAFVRGYVQLQKLRYGEESFSFEVMMEEETAEYRIPLLLIHHFVENSIKHAVSLDNRVEITLYIAKERYEDKEMLYICISDTGKGFDADVLEAVRTERPMKYGGRYHYGISNSVKRLRLLYGEEAQLRLFNMEEGGGAVVEIRLPAVTSPTPPAPMSVRSNGAEASET